MGRRWRCSPRATALRGPHGSYMGMVLAFDDLTELLKAQRLAAWREVAQRIAHEIKNPLTPISSPPSACAAASPGTGAPPRSAFWRSDGHHHPGGGRAEAPRGRVLALRPHARPHPQADRRRAAPRGRRRPLPGLAPGAVHPGGVSPELGSLQVDPDQLKRAVLNLVDNAVEAVSQTGDVTVETVWLPEAGRARIIVSDKGRASPDEDKERLFVPYFSTKATGMGLGLPIVHQIVTDHGGTIWVEDNPPHGSRFVIELPGERVPAAPVGA